MANYYGGLHKEYWGSVFEGFVNTRTLDELSVAELMVNKVKNNVITPRLSEVFKWREG